MEVVDMMVEEDISQLYFSSFNFLFLSFLDFSPSLFPCSSSSFFKNFIRLYMKEGYG